MNVIIMYFLISANAKIKPLAHFLELLLPPT